MPELRGITVSVGYGDLLAITLPRNARYFAECLVVTSPEDERTRAVVESIPNARLYVTDAHRRHGARFNKGLSLELGFDELGRQGWICIWDADCLFPDILPLDRIRPGQIYGAKRRTLEDPGQWSPEFRWSQARPEPDSAPIGFFQLFHADDPAIRDKRPWYDVSFAHAAGGDAYFLAHWPRPNRKRLPLEVLHLGKPDRNWFGVDDEGRALMAKYVHRYGWHRGMKHFPSEAAELAGELPGRIEVPGYAPSSFELPFERRARHGLQEPSRPADLATPRTRPHARHLR